MITLLRAFRMVINELGRKYKLVVAGERGWHYSPIFDEIRRLGIEQEVIFLGYVKHEEELPFLYAGAELMAYPSLYEGFGLPPLEAMACGCPVVTSNVSSLPEVVGEAGILVDPHNEVELAHAMIRVLIDEDFRNMLAQKGLERAAEFTWEKAAKETTRIYDKVYSQHGR